ncbi:hypothetical protein BpHYR1_041255 [Brachionus plicatilis]|uniref:Uncharacterized protein n=1 Tax=Brachionus plicatilis TaxID=10195 RepID=A0A3M7PYG4_BRAPC|nr:hypothetical protein BpHYR1_041255 [Brachionus plicatilis]
MFEMVGKAKLFTERKEKAFSYLMYQSILNNNEDSIKQFILNHAKQPIKQPAIQLFFLILICNYNFDFFDLIMNLVCSIVFYNNFTYNFENAFKKYDKQRQKKDFAIDIKIYLC